ncbi:MAG: biotin/lipoyl-binding protein [Lachnospiraceae bacterium]|nr:biotin/lipoyl-binding protein [Lachnospiraceae bacterium]
MSRSQRRKTGYSIKGSGALMRLLVVLIFLLFVMSGCGKSDLPSAPELMEPLQGTLAFRPASKKLVGFVRRLPGNVVPEEYPVYNEKGCEVTSVKVAVGDYVKEGDVIAVADKDGLDEELRQINSRIASLERQREKTVKLYDQTFGLLNYKKQTEAEIGGEEYAPIIKEEQNEQENLRYELAVIDAKIKAEKEQIDQTRKRLNKIEFIAPHNGYITYLKDFTDGNLVGGFDNLAVISDYNDLHVEVPDVDIEKYKYGDYQSKWTEINGERIPIEEYEYSVSEIAYAKAAKKFPCMRFRVPGADLKLGESVMLQFMDGPLEERLAVGNDSLYRDGMDAYVYVRIDDQGNTEKRKVEAGIGDEYYTEIKSGLAEGEWVLYSSNEYAPLGRDEYEATIRTYTENAVMKTLVVARPYTDIYLVPHDGRLTFKTSAAGVEEGEELFSLSYTGGDAKIEAAAVAIDDLNTSHRVFLKDYEKSKKELDRTMASLTEKEPMIGAKSQIEPFLADLEALRSSMNAEAEVRASLNKLEIEKEYEQKEYEAQSAKLSADLTEVKKQSGGSHDITVKAKNAGKPASIEMAIDSPVQKGQYLMSVQRFGPEGSRTKLFCKQPPADGNDNCAKVGSEVTFITNDEREFKGHCIGANPGDSKNYLFTKDGEAMITTSNAFAGRITNQFYVEMDEIIDENWMFKAQLQYEAEHYPLAVCVPASSIHEEYNMISSRDPKKFVWKVVDGTPVKEYVEILETERAKSSVMILRGVTEGDLVLQ